MRRSEEEIQGGPMRSHHEESRGEHTMSSFPNLDIYTRENWRRRSRAQHPRRQKSQREEETELEGTL
jgi:hypothetical protein